MRIYRPEKFRKQFLPHRFTYKYVYPKYFTKSK